MLLRSVKLWLSVIFFFGWWPFFWPRLPKENVLNIMIPIFEHWKIIPARDPKQCGGAKRYETIVAVMMMTSPHR